MIELREQGDLTPEILTDLLAEMNPGVSVKDLTVTRDHQGSASHLHLDVIYEAGKDGGLPEHLFFKTQLATVFDLPDHMANMLSKSVTAGLLANETRFYRDARPNLDIEAPRASAVRLLPDPTQFILIIEHLEDRGATFPNPGIPLSVDQVHATLTTLSRLHAELWNSPRLGDGDLAWLRPPLPDTLEGRARRTSLFERIRLTLEEPAKAASLASSGIDSGQLEVSFWRLQEVVNEGPRMLPRRPAPGQHLRSTGRVGGSPRLAAYPPGSVDSRRRLRHRCCIGPH